jgi:ABC-type branched-subunit amino acid transport system ATPase component
VWAVVPDPAAVFQADRLREPAGCGDVRPSTAQRSRSRPQCAVILERTELIESKANQAAGGLSLLERKRLELARAMATHPKLLLLDEIAGGLTDGECQSLIETIKAIHAEGVTIIWIEHVLHALNSVVERLLVLDFGKVIGIGDPADHGVERGQGDLPGDRHMTALLETRGLTARYGDFQALFGVDLTWMKARPSPSSAPTARARQR